MNSLYNFFGKWNIGKIIFWYRIFAYTFFLKQSFKIREHYNNVSNYSPESADQVTQVATDTTMNIVYHFTEIATVALILIALEIQWAGKRNNQTK